MCVSYIQILADTEDGTNAIHSSEFLSFQNTFFSELLSDLTWTHMRLNMKIIYRRYTIS